VVLPTVFAPFRWRVSPRAGVPPMLVVHAPLFFFFFPCSSGFSLDFGFGLYFGFTLYFGFDFHMYFGLWVFLGGLFGFSCGFWGFVGLGCFRSRFGCLLGASFVCWALGVMGALCGFWVLGLFFVGLFEFFLLWVGFGGSYVYSRCT